jgi:hypothetical protein
MQTVNRVAYVVEAAPILIIGRKQESRHGAHLHGHESLTDDSSQQIAETQNRIAQLEAKLKDQGKPAAATAQVQAQKDEAKSW